jgi:xanthine dehydrogenase accessory factor
MTDSNQKELLDAIAAANQAHESFAVISVVKAHSVETKLMMREGGRLSPGAVEAEWLDTAVSLARGLLSSGNNTTLTDFTRSDGEHIKIAIEAIRPKAQVVIFGGGHVGHALATMSMLAGYGVLVIDDREAFASRDRLPDTRIDLLVAPFPEAARNVQITTNTAIVIVTRGHQHDEVCLRAVANSNARYIGMIGSRRRVISVFKKLAESGIPQAKLDRVHAPIGLRIGARSPQEIAVAILGEIIQTFNSPPPA